VGVAGAVRVVDVEPPAAPVVGRERDGEQALLAAAADLAADVEERRAPALGVDADDPPGLLDDVERPLALCLRQVDRRVELADALQAHPAHAVAGWLPAGRRGRRRWLDRGRADNLGLLLLAAACREQSQSGRSDRREGCRRSANGGHEPTVVDP
jgi:hypothetical protein